MKYKCIFRSAWRLFGGTASAAANAVEPAFAFFQRRARGGADFFTPAADRSAIVARA
jgi:hypothetical protein